jgi:hypothetical protein
MTEVFNLFEGVCPSCGGEVTITGVDGMPGFVKQHCPKDPDISSMVWVARPRGDICDGEITFKCGGCSQEFVVGHNIHGDWNL